MEIQRRGEGDTNHTLPVINAALKLDAGGNPLGHHVPQSIDLDHAQHDIGSAPDLPVTPHDLSFPLHPLFHIYQGFVCNIMDADPGSICQRVIGGYTEYQLCLG